MSRAVDFCPECVRPDAFLNVVFFIPNERAFLVIRFAKATSEPAIASPSATAASFADLTAVALIRSRIDTRLPALNPILDGTWRAARREIRTF